MTPAVGAIGMNPAVFRKHPRHSGGMRGILRMGFEKKLA
jgi:hypothetical protein